MGALILSEWKCCFTMERNKTESLILIVAHLQLVVGREYE